MITFPGGIPRERAFLVFRLAAMFFQIVIDRVLSRKVLLLAVPALFLWLRTRGKTREELYDVLYSMNWGGTTTNNLGFTPAEGDGPERFQLQMYEELYKLLRTRGGARGRERLLEVSCGRGGGFNYLVNRWESPLRAVGLDLSPTAIEYCKRRYTGLNGDAEFVHGSALELPFEDASFEVVVNVESSHVYSDDRLFFREAHRVLRPGGVFLFADFRTQWHACDLEARLRHIGFEGKLHDITDNVARACALDSGRRLRLIQTATPWYYRPLIVDLLQRYACVEGTSRLEKFRNRSQVYLIACMIKLV
jgi:ubiquinone/menaquinone biosynthesis C-methylase UbiE